MTSSSDKVLNSSIKIYFRQILAAVTATLFAVSDGMAYGWTSPMIPYLISDGSHIQTTHYEAEWLETALLCGALCGLPLTIYSVDKFGRKRSLIFASFTILIGWLLIALGNTIIYLFVGRFFLGMAGDMAFVACPMYMAEISDQRIRGFLSGIIYMMVHTGTVIVYIVGPYTPHYVTPIIGIFLVTTELLVFSFMPESPYYLISKGKEEEAKKALQFFKPYQDIEKEVTSITEMLVKQNITKVHPQDLILVKSNRKAITIMTVLNTGQHLCAYTVILMNLHLILAAAGSIYMDSSLTAIIFATIMLVSVTFASLQVDKYGRRMLIMVSAIVSGLCLLALAVYFHLKYLHIDVSSVSWIPLVSVMIYAAFFKAGAGLVPIILTAEIFPSNMKAIGMTVADGMFILGGIIAIQIYQILTRLINIYLPFYVFGGYAFFVAIFTYFCIPETKGRSLQEIQSILKGESIEPKKLNKEIETIS
ncbi:unnamed protein product [Diabrotica balteata]|uniref:Major facilitator superfamily (MFS) profile domain-containing protein n=1 Tax=Diabrotica balteata TaxID=107213 RepID=A0A9N9XFT6_DIABA|nr:unnamed protein product [Diabrotica balteata]